MLWHCCQGLFNSPWALVLYICTCVLVRINIGLSATTPTRGEILVQLGTLSRKPRSVKRKSLGSDEKDRSVLAKAPKLGVSSTFSV